MPVSAADVLDEEVIEAIVEETRPDHYVFRRAFRNHDATGINSNSLTFPEVDFDLEGELVEVPENAKYPRATLNQGQFKAAYTKYGFEVPVSDTAIADSMLDIEADAGRQMSEEEERRLDEIAGAVIEANRDSTTINASGTSDGALEYDDFLETRKEFYAAGYTTNNLQAFVGPEEMTNLPTLPEFTRATEMGDAAVRRALLPGQSDLPSALLGEIIGIPVWVSNVTDLVGGEAYVVNTGKYGWESTREPFSVTTYREEDHDQTIHKLRGRMDWISTDSLAAKKIVS